MNFIDTRATSFDLAKICAETALGKKGENISVLKVGDLIGITDYFVIVTTTNRYQAQAIANEIQKKLKLRGYRCSPEGYASGWWILLDFDEVVVHLFQPDAREFYDLDHLWEEASREKLDLSPPTSPPESGRRT